MAARGSKLSRAVDYFRTASHDEARVAYTLVTEIMNERLRPTKVTRTKRTRKSQAAATPNVAAAEASA
jgi:hypothetical protein